MDGTYGPAEGELRRFWQFCPELLAVLDPEGAFVAANGAWSVRFGWSTSALRGRLLVEVVHPDDRARVEAALAELRASASTAELELRLRSSDGGHRDVQAVLRSFPTGPGGGATIHLTALDVTDRRRAEAALAATSEQLAVAMEAAPIGMVLSDLDGRARVVNEALCRLLGRSRDEVLGLRLDEAADPRDRGSAREHLARMLSEGVESHRFDLRFVGGSGRAVHTEVTGCVVRDVDGEPVYILGQIVDMTHRHEAESRLRDAVAELQDSQRRTELANEMLEHFASTASHDLRGPLGTVHALLETVLLRQAAPLHDRDRDLLGRARDQAARLMETTDAVLALSRQGGEGRSMEPVDLDDVVSDVLESLEPDLRGAGAQVEVAGLPTVVGDGPMLRSLVQNLVSNAVKFSHPDRHPRVAIAAQPSGDFWLLSVADNGIGLSPEQADVIFDRFARAGDVRARRGSGLGLATCRQIAEAHGGDIRAEPLAQGVRFVVRLPASEHDARR